MRKIREHKLVFAFSLAAIVLCSIGTIVVFLWHVDTSPIGLQGQATFDQWSLDWVVRFGLLLVLWELLFVGLPAGLFFGVGGYLWWRRLSADEKSAFRIQNRKDEDKKKHPESAGGVAGILLFICYCIYMAIEGNYYAAFGTQPYSYWILSYLVMVGWLLLLVGLPAGIAGLVWFLKRRQ